MTRRANVAVRRNGEVTLYDARGDADVLQREVFWGPDAAETYAADHPTVEDGAWCDELSAEAGMALDFDAKTVVVFGGDRISVQPYRSVFVGLMEQLWRRWGWKVRWAELGLARVVSQLGVAPALVSSSDLGMLPASTQLRSRLGSRHFITTIITDLRSTDRFDRVADLGAADLMLMGPSLLEAVEALPGLDSIGADPSDSGWGTPSFLDTDPGRWPGAVTSSLVLDRRSRRIIYSGVTLYGELQRQRALWTDSAWCFDYLGTMGCEFCAHFRRQGRAIPADLQSHVCSDLASEAELVQEIADFLFDPEGRQPGWDIESMTRRFGWALAGWWQHGP